MAGTSIKTSFKNGLGEKIQNYFPTAILDNKLNFIQISDKLIQIFGETNEKGVSTKNLKNYSSKKDFGKSLRELAGSIKNQNKWIGFVNFKIGREIKSFEVFSFPLDEDSHSLSFVFFVDRTDVASQVEMYRTQAYLYLIGQIASKNDTIKEASLKIIKYISSIPELYLQSQAAFILQSIDGVFELAANVGNDQHEFIDEMVRTLNSNYTETLELLDSLENSESLKGIYIIPLIWKDDFFGVFIFHAQTPNKINNYIKNFLVLAGASIAYSYREYLLVKRIERKNDELAEMTNALSASEEELRQQAEELSMLNEQLNSENLKISEEKHDLTSNITHARRLQLATMPKVDVIKSFFPESFLYYTPRDIVSGDFYWFHHVEEQEKILFLLGDSSGHGVSASFLSVIAIQILDKIANVYKIFEPHLILKHLDKEFNEALGINENSEVNDSLEISIGLYDPKTRGLYYASGNRPCFVIRDNEIIVLQKQRQYIGGRHFKKFSVKTEFFQLQKGDKLYAFTDGVVDQFGGEKDKKLGTKAFKDLLLAIHNKKMSIQAKKVSEFMDDWISRYQQTDDISVAGLLID